MEYTARMLENTGADDTKEYIRIQEKFDRTAQTSRSNHNENDKKEYRFIGTKLAN